MGSVMSPLKMPEQLIAPLSQRLQLGLLLFAAVAGLGCADETEGERPSVDISLNASAQFRCGDGLCHPSEDAERCPIDCAYCGDQLCSSMESPALCPLDCPLAPAQGDARATRTPEDAGVERRCGDQRCTSDESPRSCPEDCSPDMLPPSPPPSGPPPDPDAQLIGHIDGISLEEGRWVVSGWACHIGWAPSVEIEIYAGGPAGEGALIRRAIAAEEQEDAVGEVCGVAEGDHRFRIPFSDDELEQYAGEQIYIHGVSPVGNENAALTNSGRYSLPGGGAVIGDGADEFPLPLDQVTWLHTDVSGWPITTELQVSFQGGSICLSDARRDTWPSVSIPHSSGNGNVNVVANPWVFLEYQGQWYAATWEWLAVGTTCRNMSAVAGDHIKRFAQVPEDWRPSSGQQLYFMVSGLARSGDITNLQERSQIVEVRWP